MKKCFQINEKKHADLMKLKSELFIETNNELVTFLLNTNKQFIEHGGLDFVKKSTIELEKYLKNIKDNHPHLSPILIRSIGNMVDNFEP